MALTKNLKTPDRQEAKTAIDDLLREIENSDHTISSGPLSDEDLVFLEEKFDVILKKWGVDNKDYCEELALLYGQSRAYSDPLRVLVSGLLYYGTPRDIPEQDLLDEHNLSVTCIRKNGISPIFISRQEIEDKAQQMADIVDANDRATIEYIPMSYRYRESIGNIDFKTLCERDFLFIDTGSGSRQNGILTRQEAANALDTKIKCSHCPLKDLCLATSLASPQTTRMSKKDKTIPNSVGDTLTVIDYLMFGGYTPQERRVIFERMCDILEERDKDRRRNRQT